MTHHHDPYSPHSTRPSAAGVYHPDETKPETRAEPKKVEAPEPKKVEAETKPETKAETKPETKAETKKVEAPEPTPETKTETKPETKAEPEKVEALEPPPMYGPGSGVTAWREYATATSSKSHKWDELSRGEILELLKAEDIPVEPAVDDPESESKPASVAAKPVS